jgi:hypothetical protein
MTEFRVEFIRAVDQIPVGRSTWNDRVSHNEVNEIFLTHEWVFSWLDAQSRAPPQAVLFG